MLVKNWMTRNPFCVDQNEPMVNAINLFRGKKVGKLPVTKDGRLVGILSTQDIKIIFPSEHMYTDPDELQFIKEELKTKDVMTKPVITIEEEATIEKAAAKMLKYRVSGLPVLNQNKDIIGILTLGDIFKLLIDLTGLYQGKYKVEIRMEDRPGSIKDGADVIRAFSGRIVSILTSYNNVDDGYRKVYIRYRVSDPSRSEDLKRKLEEDFEVLSFSTDILDDL